MALWREGLLAQKVLTGATRGYRSHPQLERFRAHPQPGCAIVAYLHAVCDEAQRRGYRFDRAKIAAFDNYDCQIPVADGQMQYEFTHLCAKLSQRDPSARERLRGIPDPEPHPCFVVVPGPVASWERNSA